MLNVRRSGSLATSVLACNSLVRSKSLSSPPFYRSFSSGIPILSPSASSSSSSSSPSPSPSPSWSWSGSSGQGAHCKHPFRQSPRLLFAAVGFLSFCGLLYRLEEFITPSVAQTARGDSKAADPSSSSSCYTLSPEQSIQAMRIMLEGSIEELENFVKKQNIPLDPNDKQVRKECVHLAEDDDLLESTEENTARTKKNKKYVAIRIAHPLGFSAIHVAAACGRTDMIEWLLAHGADINEKEKFNIRIPMNMAIERHSTRQIVFPGINPRVNTEGYTALHWAAMLCRVQAVECLIAHGAMIDEESSSTDIKVKDVLLEWELLELSTKTLQELNHRKQQVLDILKEAPEKRRKLHEQREERRRKKEKEDRLRFPLEEKLKAAMVGQLMPIYSVASAIRRHENGWFDENKPLVFLFLGSSGVGKTMLARELASHLAKDPKNGFIRLDMSEFSQPHQASRLIGAPPSFVGFDQGGELTNKLQKCPDAVVLLDEIEKASPDVLTLMLQVFDEGRLTDGKGETIHCPNAIFIMTSNLVQDEIRQALDDGVLLRPYKLEKEAREKKQEQTGKYIVPTSSNKPLIETEPSQDNPPSNQTKQNEDSSSVKVVPSPSRAVSTPLFISDEAKTEILAQVATETDDFLKKTVHPLLKRFFKRDEFLGRINDIVIFHSFSDDDLRYTVNEELKRWAQKAKERHDIELTWTDRLVDSLKNGFDERYGYRSIIYAVEKRVINVIAAAHEKDQITNGSRINLDIPEGEQRVVIKSVEKEPSDSAEKKGKKKLFGLF